MCGIAFEFEPLGSRERGMSKRSSFQCNNIPEQSSCISKLEFFRQTITYCDARARLERKKERKKEKKKERKKALFEHGLQCKTPRMLISSPAYPSSFNHPTPIRPLRMPPLTPSRQLLTSPSSTKLTYLFSFPICFPLRVGVLPFPLRPLPQLSSPNSPKVSKPSRMSANSVFERGCSASSRLHSVQYVSYSFLIFGA